MSYHIPIAYLGYINILFLSLVIIFTLLFAFFFLYCLLDSFYRPNYPQYPYNWFLDRLLPILCLFTPSIYVICFLELSLVNKLTTLLLLHLLLILIFHYWSNLRNWNSAEKPNTWNSAETRNTLSWSSPKIFKHISIAFIYPYVYAIYFSILRILKIGKTVDLSNFKLFDFCLEYGIYVFYALMLYYECILLVIFITFFIKHLRNVLWENFLSLVYSFHLFLLQFTVYFKICEFIFKLYQIINYVIGAKNPKIWYQLKNYSNFSKLRDILYFYPQVLSFLVILFIISELLFYKTISYSYYILFFYPLFYGLLMLFVLFGKSDFIFDTCFSDYIYGRWENSRYPINFWEKFFDADTSYGFSYTFSKAQIEYLRKFSQKFKWCLRKNTNRYHHNLLLTERVNNKGHLLRFKANYLNVQGVRFFATLEANVNSRSYFFAKNFLSRLTLIAMDWPTNYPIMTQKYNKLDKPIICKDFYITEINVNKNPIFTKLTDFIEYNSLYHLYNLKKTQDVELSLWQDDFQTDIKAKQERPDIFLKMISQDEQIKLGLDLKNTVRTSGNCLISAFSEENYSKILFEGYKKLERQNIITPQIKNFFLTMHALNTKNEFNNMLDLWGANLLMFKLINYIPPLRVKSLINSDYFQTQIQAEYLEKLEIMEKISSYLNQLKVTKQTHHPYQMGLLIKDNPTLNELYSRL